MYKRYSKMGRFIHIIQEARKTKNILKIPYYLKELYNINDVKKWTKISNWLVFCKDISKADDKDFQEIIFKIRAEGYRVPR